MDTIIVKADLSNEWYVPEVWEKNMSHAGRVIREGGLVAFPTETVYGLGGNALDKRAAEKIYRAKGRPSDNPLIVHISRISQAENIAVNISHDARRLMEEFWPGPLTIILDKADIVPKETTGGLDTVALRMPNHPVALKLIEEAGVPVAAPSANLSGKPSPTTAGHVAEDMMGRINMIVDGGTVAIGIESTIIDMTGAVPTILRPGFVTVEMLKKVIGAVEVDKAVDAKSIEEIGGDYRPKAPGMKYRHYAPRGNLVIVEGAQDKVIGGINSRLKDHRQAGEKTGVIATDETAALYRADSVKSLGLRRDEMAIAKHLFRILREFDEEEVQFMYAESFEATGMGQAIMNRLLKAAGHHMIHL